MMLKKPASTNKVEVQAKVEIKRVWSSLNLDLNLSLVHSLRASHSIISERQGERKWVY